MNDQTPAPTPSDDLWSDSEIERFRNMLGGKRGIMDGAIPALAFVISNALWSLNVAAIVSGTYGLASVLYRLIRRQPTRQALIGLAGLGVSVGIALWTGSASTFFIPGVIWGAVTGLLLLASVALKQPSSGMIQMALEHKPQEHYQRPEVLRANMIVTSAWALMFLSRAGLRAYLVAKGQTELLGASALVLGYPLTIGFAAGSVWFLRKQTAHLEPLPAPIAGGDPIGTTEPASEL